METRSKSILCAIGSLEFFRTDPLNLTVAQQLPTFGYFYGRYETMKSSYENNKEKDQLILNDLTDEFTYIWTHCSIPFMSLDNRA